MGLEKAVATLATKAPVPPVTPIVNSEVTAAFGNASQASARNILTENAARASSAKAKEIKFVKVGEGGKLEGGVDTGKRTGIKQGTGEVRTGQDKKPLTESRDSTKPEQTDGKKSSERQSKGTPESPRIMDGIQYTKESNRWFSANAESKRYINERLDQWEQSRGPAPESGPEREAWMRDRSEAVQAYSRESVDHSLEYATKAWEQDNRMPDKSDRPGYEQWFKDREEFRASLREDLAKIYDKSATSGEEVSVKGPESKSDTHETGKTKDDKSMEEMQDGSPLEQAERQRLQQELIRLYQRQAELNLQIVNALGQPETPEKTAQMTALMTEKGEVQAKIDSVLKELGQLPSVKKDPTASLAIGLMVATAAQQFAQQPEVQKAY